MSEDEWVTFTSNKDLGGNKDNTKIFAGSFVNTNFVKVKDLTLSAENNGGDVFASASSFLYLFNLWIDDCILIGDTKFRENSRPVSNGRAKVWYTDSYFTNMGKAVSGAEIARNLTIEHIGDDVAVNSPFVVNISADDVDPRDGTCVGGGCAHADCWQWWGAPVPHNMIIYGLNCTNAAYQGLFARTQGMNPVGFQNPVTEGAAIINLNTQRVAGSYGASNAWYIPTDHMLMWHNTFNDEFNFWNDGDASGSFPLNITNFDVRGNNFFDVELNSPLGDDNGGDSRAQGIELDLWFDNHYLHVAGWEYFSETPGSGITTGDPMVDELGRPQAGSSLINRINNPMVPVDILGNLRASISDIGAFEYQNAQSAIIRADVNQDFSINTTDAMLTLRNSLGLSMTGTAWQSSATTGDVNCDDNSNSSDAMLVLRYSLGLDMSGTDWCE